MVVDTRYAEPLQTLFAGDIRTQYCIDHSIALLLIELSRSL